VAWLELGTFGAGLVVGLLLTHFRRRHRRRWSLRVDYDDEAATSRSE